MKHKHTGIIILLFLLTNVKVLVNAVSNVLNIKLMFCTKSRSNRIFYLCSCTNRFIIEDTMLLQKVYSAVILLLDKQC